MASNFKAVIFDLGGVLLEWDRHSVATVTAKQLVTIMNSAVWYELERGNLTVQQACDHFGPMLTLEPIIVEAALKDAQKSLKIVSSLIETIQDLKSSNPELQFYVMSNIAQEHFEIVQKLALPWSDFTQVFASGHEGMRKPDLCFWRRVLKQIGVKPSETIMVDDTSENICAARSLGIQGLLVDCPKMASAALRNLLQDSLLRAETFMKTNAGKHHSIIQGYENVSLKDNFSQIMIRELIGDVDVIYLKYPSGAVQRNKDFAKGSVSPFVTNVEVFKNVKYGLWNYFCEEPFLTTKIFPADADTTSMAYIVLPEADLVSTADPNLVLDKMLANKDMDGVLQTYFCAKRPRIVPEVCCNILRAFYRFGRGADPRLDVTKDWVVSCLINDAFLDGNRHYSTSETFLYFISHLYEECGSGRLREELELVKEKLEERIGVPVNPLALALRLFACQKVGIGSILYKKDLKLFMSLQESDGGWPAGHFCRYGRTGNKIGNRGITTALGVRIIQHERKFTG